jgi:EAL domain-containing protein (putative c-di-GMP-specific phosphodiesterase class I)/GGDEF domain-containing protein
MRLTDVLKLKPNIENLETIKTFLNQSRSHIEYQAAISRYFEIAEHLKLYELIQEESTQVLKDTQNQSKTIYYEAILKHMIDACIELENFEQAKKLIDLRKSELPVLKQYLFYLDEIKYKKALNLPITDEINYILNDVVPDEVKIYALKEMLTIYQIQNENQKALDVIYQLYNFDLEHEYINDEFLLLIKLNAFQDILSKAIPELKNNNPYAIYALIYTYLKQDDLHKASALEAEYEVIIDQSEQNLRKLIYETIIEVYQKMGNKLSIETYQRKLKQVSKSLDKLPKIEKKEEQAPKIVYVKQTDQKQAKHRAASFLYASELLIYSHQIDFKMPFRDYLRQLFIKAEPTLKVKEIYLFIKDENPNFFMYKKERLYDKYVHKAYIEHTVVDHILSSQLEIVEAVNNLKYQKNALTQKEYLEDVKFVFAFPLSNIGVFVAHYENEINDPGPIYDILKLTSDVIYTRLMDEKINHRLKKENRYKDLILNSPIIASRILTESKSYYNDAACQLFHIEQHHHIELFLRDVSIEHIKNYKDQMTLLRSKAGLVRDLFYKYQHLHIYEKMYALRVDDEIEIISLFYDRTKEVEKTKTLIEMATIDQKSGLENKNALEDDMVDYLKDKQTFCLIELDDQMKHIYGHEQMDVFFKEFAQVTNKFFLEGKTYRFDINQLFVSIPYNDIRTVTKKIKDYFKHMYQYTSKVLKYERFVIKMGVLRYPVVTVDRNVDKIFKYLDLSLEQAKRNKEENFIFFNYRDYEDEMFEQQVIDHLNKAIETKTLTLTFNQITDIKRNRVWQYESELTLPNLTIEAKYLKTIAKKRHRLVDLEKFHIERICEFLVELEKDTKRLIKLTIPISKETFVDPTFNTFVMGVFKKHEIPYTFIRFKFDMEIRSAYAQQLQELIDSGIGLDTTSLDMALHYPFHALHLDFLKENDKTKAFIKNIHTFLADLQIALVIRNVKNKAQKDLLEKLDVQYLEGPLYKQLPAQVLLNKIKESI